MPKTFDDQVKAIKASRKSEDEAYAIATASWKKSHGGKTPAESKKEGSAITEKEILEAVEAKVISLDEAAQLYISEGLVDEVPEGYQKITGPDRKRLGDMLWSMSMHLDVGNSKETSSYIVTKEGKGSYTIVDKRTGDHYIGKISFGDPTWGGRAEVIVKIYKKI